MIYATCKLSASMHAYTWYVVLQHNKSKENLITVQNSVVTVYLIIKGCNYCSVKVIKLWCQKDREGGILHGVTLYLCVSHLQRCVTVVWILTKSYAHHFILFNAAAKVQGQI